MRDDLRAADLFGLVQQRADQFPDTRGRGLRQLRLRGLQLFLKGRHAGRDVGRVLGLHGGGGFLQEPLVLPHRGERPRPGDGRDAADALGDGVLADNPHQADLPRVAGVGAAAQLGAEAAHLHDADLVRVLLPEQGHRALRAGFFNRQ